MTLHQLRALLERALHADGPTPPHIARLGSTVTVEDLARAYLPLDIRLQWSERIADRMEIADALREAENTYWSSRKSLCLSDPGTVHAVKIALALALGLDPGPMGCAVSWRYGAWGWVLRGADSSYMMSATIDEPDPVRALILAAEHVLCSPA